MEMPTESSGGKFEDAMNVCQKQGKKLRVNLNYGQDKLESMEFDCIEKNG